MTRKALIVTTVASTMEAFLLPHFAEMVSRGWVVDAAARGVDSSSAVKRRANQVFEIDWTRRPWDMAATLRAARMIRRVVASGHYDLVHVHTPVASFVTRFALRRMRLRRGGPSVIYTAHGFHFLRGGGTFANPVFRLLESIAAGWTDWLVTMNAEDTTAAKRMSRIDPERVVCIPGVGIDCDRYHSLTVRKRSDLRRRMGYSVDDVVVIHVAEFTANKRHELLIRAIESVPNPHVKLLLVGDGPLRQSAERLAHERLGKRVLFTGWIDDAGSAIAASDILALVSKREGLPRSVLEAMASALPVVGTPTRGVVDLVTAECGIVVAEAEPEALSSAIMDLAADPLLRQAMGAAGRARACEGYGQNLIIRRYGELYERAISSHE